MLSPNNSTLQLLLMPSNSQASSSHSSSNTGAAGGGPPSSQQLWSAASAVAVGHTPRWRSKSEEVYTREQLVAFLEEKEGSVLRAWLRHFDPDLELRVTMLTFTHTARELGFSGNTTATFNALDDDQSGELAFDEVDSEAATLWRNFREFCAQTFDSARDMHGKLRKVDRGAVLAPKLVTPMSWKENLVKLGWTEGSENVLFEALEDVRGGSADRARTLTQNNLKWLDTEIRRRKRKEQAKEKARQEMRHRGRKNGEESKTVLEKFKRFLKSKYGTYLRAWRLGLSPGDTMTLQKIPFFKACADMGWKHDVKLLWHAFGKDDMSSLCLDELDARSAVALAHFQVIVEKQCGGSLEAFRALDRSKIQKVRYEDFCTTLRDWQFKHPMKLLFHGLDRQGNKCLVQEDLEFLDRWKPPAFLIVSPNPQAQREIKEALLSRYRSPLKAWRRTLDLSGTNRCGWLQFSAACKKLGYQGDVAGAWRSMDAEMSGYITLREIDEESSALLSDFRHWSFKEFGGVRSVLSAIEETPGEGVTLRDLRRGLRIYGYEGNSHRLFKILDVENTGTLGTGDVSFLDEWNLPPPPEKEAQRMKPRETWKRIRMRAVASLKWKEAGQVAAERRASSCASSAGLDALAQAHRDREVDADCNSGSDKDCSSSKCDGNDEDGHHHRSTSKSRWPVPGGGGAPRKGPPRLQTEPRRCYWHEVPERKFPISPWVQMQIEQKSCRTTSSRWSPGSSRRDQGSFEPHYDVSSSTTCSMLMTSLHSNSVMTQGLPPLDNASDESHLASMELPSSEEHSEQLPPKLFPGNVGLQLHFAMSKNGSLSARARRFYDQYEAWLRHQHKVGGIMLPAAGQPLPLPLPLLPMSEPRSARQATSTRSAAAGGATPQVPSSGISTTLPALDTGPRGAEAASATTAEEAVPTSREFLCFRCCSGHFCRGSSTAAAAAAAAAAAQDRCASTGSGGLPCAT